MPRVRRIEEVVGAPVIAAATCIRRGGAWATDEMSGVPGAPATSALQRRAIAKDGAPVSVGPQGDVVVAVTATEIVTTTYSDLFGVKAGRVNGRLPRAEVVGADLRGGRIIKTLTLHLADGPVWSFDCRTVAHKDAARLVAALGF